MLRADGSAQVFVGAFLSQNVAIVGLQDLEEHGRRRRPWTRGLSAEGIRVPDCTLDAKAFEHAVGIGDVDGQVV